MSPHFRLKKLTAYPDWHKKPLLLNRAEMADPFSVLAAFFDCYDLTILRVALKQWLDEALRGEETNAASHLYTHERISKLVEAAWLITEQKRQASADEGFDTTVQGEEGDAEEKDAGDEEKEKERERFVKWVPFAAHLKADPLAYLYRVFELSELDGLEEVVYRWQRLALAADYGHYENGGERADLLDFCEGFIRLLQAAYVLKRCAEWDTAGRTRWVLSGQLKYALLTEERTYRISKDEIGHPLEVINRFFRTFSPAYARRELWEMLACAVEYKGEELKRLDLLLDYECLHAALEAAWLFYNQPPATNEAKTENQIDSI